MSDNQRWLAVLFEEIEDSCGSNRLRQEGQSWIHICPLCSRCRKTQRNWWLALNRCSLPHPSHFHVGCILIPPREIARDHLQFSPPLGFARRGFDFSVRIFRRR
uniref:Uncharacterized protein n=1 Tax=Chelativorans sp. (strain BNC1) TaxID=266779 RepID=Q11MC5_CHESB